MSQGREFGRVAAVLVAFGIGWFAGQVLYGKAVWHVDPGQRGSTPAHQVMRAPKLLDSAQGALLWVAAVGAFVIPTALGGAFSQPGLTRRWLLFPVAGLLAKTGYDLWQVRHRLPLYDHPDGGPVRAVIVAELGALACIAAGFVLGIVLAVFVERFWISRSLERAAREDRAAKRHRVSS